MLKCAKEAKKLIEMDKAEQRKKETSYWMQIKTEAKENTEKFAEYLVNSLIKKNSVSNKKETYIHRFSAPNEYNVSYELKSGKTRYSNGILPQYIDTEKPIDVDLLLSMLKEACYDVKFVPNGDVFYFNSYSTEFCAIISISLPDNLPCD